MATEPTPRVAANGRPVSKVGPAKDAESTDKKGGKDGAAKKGGKKKLIIIMLVVLLGGGGGAYFMLGKKPAKPGPPKPGVIIAMTDTTLNLADGHFLKIKLALQTIVGAPADLDTSKASDLMIAEFTNQPIAALSTDAGREKMKDDLLKKIEAAYPKQIMDLYYTDFVMQ